MNKTITYLVVAGTLAACAIHAAAETHILAFDTNQGTACQSPYTEQGCTFTFIGTTTQDCIVAGQLGFCYPQYLSHPTLGSGYGVAPARMHIEFPNVQGVQTVEVQIYEAHEIGCTRTFLYSGDLLVDSAASTVEGVNHWLTLSAGGAAVDHLYVSGHEGYVWEIRLIGDDLVGAQASSWGVLKSRY